jgi:hypothetical protein
MQETYTFLRKTRSRGQVRLLARMLLPAISSLNDFGVAACSIVIVDHGLPYL